MPLTTVYDFGTDHGTNEDYPEESDESKQEELPVESTTRSKKRKQGNSEGKTPTVRRKKSDKGASSSTVEGEVPQPSEETPPSTSPADSPSPNFPDDTEKVESAPKKTVKRRKVDSTPDGSGTKPNPPKLSKKEQAVQDFMLDILPALKKNLKQKKSQSQAFRIRDHGEYFTASSKFIPTYLLGLFHFLGVEEIVCSRYGNFDSKHMVKTSAGFNHASLLINHCDSLGENEISYLMKKFGKEWFKIPSKDGVKASSANRYGDKGDFRVILVGLYEDSFRDSEGAEVFTINPILRYEPVKAKKEKE